MSRARESSTTLMKITHPMPAGSARVTTGAGDALRKTKLLPRPRPRVGNEARETPKGGPIVRLPPPSKPFYLPNQSGQGTGHLQPGTIYQGISQVRLPFDPIPLLPFVSSNSTIFPSWHACVSQTIAQLRSPSTLSPNSFSELLTCSYASSTRVTYACALELFLRWAVSSAPVSRSFVEAVQRYLISLFSPPRGSHARVLLAALALVAQSFPAIPALPSSCWAGVRAIVRHQPAPRRTWFFVHYLEPTAADIDWECSKVLYGVLLFSFVYLLRISEAAAICSGDFQSGNFAVHAAKRGKATYWRPVAEALRPWADFFAQQRLESGKSFFTTTSLSSAFKQYTAQIGALTFHALRRGGASTLAQLGLAPDRLLQWGRWRGMESARLYFEVEQCTPALPESVHVFQPDGSVASVPPARLWPDTLFSSTPLQPPRSASSSLPTTSVVSGKFSAPSSIVATDTPSVEPGVGECPDDICSSSSSGGSDRGHNFTSHQTSTASNPSKSPKRGGHLRKRPRAARPLE